MPFCADAIVADLRLERLAIGRSRGARDWRKYIAIPIASHFRHLPSILCVGCMVYIVAGNFYSQTVVSDGDASQWRPQDGIFVAHSEIQYVHGLELDSAGS